MQVQMLAVAFLVTVAAGGVVWVFVYPILSGERHAEKRKASFTKAGAAPGLASPKGGPRARREQVEETLKEFEVRRKRANSVPLSVRIEQAGLSWSKQQFWLVSAGLGIAMFAICLFVGVALFAALGMGFAAAFGAPRWLLTFLKNRRESQFIDRFPDSVDIIVRGVKAGLPLGDCLKIIANEAQEPVRSEFRMIIETQTVGIPLGDACGKLYDRIPLPEANFFGIVIGIQQKSGGNLSEALGNLSRVLRDRKRMKQKIQAMSMEAKASASIIASLPFAVIGLVYLTSPNYIEMLWTTSIGRMLMAGCAVWMVIGVLVMRKMINFDF